MAVTTDAVIRLAKACPNLRRIQLEATYNIGDDALHALCEYCPNLISVEISAGNWSNRGVSEAALEELRKNLDMAPNLKTLALTDAIKSRNKYLKAVRALTREREGLTVTLVRKYQVKKDGDWEFDGYRSDYKEGREKRISGLYS